MGLISYVKRKIRNGPDFSTVNSAEKVETLVDKGELAPVYLMPLRFEGEETERNRLFVPPSVAELKDQYDDVVEQLYQQKKISSYTCVPRYRGKSFVPSKLIIMAGKDGMIVFEETINIW